MVTPMSPVSMDDSTMAWCQLQTLELDCCDRLFTCPGLAHLLLLHGAGPLQLTDVASPTNTRTFTISCP